MLTLFKMFGVQAVFVFRTIFCRYIYRVIIKTAEPKNVHKAGIEQYC